MPFYLYEIRHARDEGVFTYSAGFWAPTLEAADEHLHVSMGEATEKQADHIESERSSADVDILDDGARGFWITWTEEGADSDHMERLSVAAPFTFETPQELSLARNPEHTPWEIGAVE